MPELVSSAEKLSGEHKKARLDLTDQQAIQNEVWDLFERVPELGVAATWIATQESKMVVVPKMWDTKTGQWVAETDPLALSVIPEMGDQSELFRTWGYNSVLAAEAMWIYTDRWQLVSRRSIDARSDGKLYYNPYGDGATPGQSRPPTGTLPLIHECYRIFLPSPKFAKLAYTPAFAMREDLAQLKLFRSTLTQKLKARYWMNGIWVFGQKVTMATQQGRNTPAGRGKFLSDLRLLVEANMRRKDDASDAAPIFLQTATPDVGDVIKQYYPEVKIDERETELRREVRATLREMFDLPVEQQTSKGDLNHWGQFTIREENIVDGLEPRALALMNPLSGSWYYDRLVAKGMTPDQARLHKLVVSTDNLKPPPSSDEVRQAHDRGEASGDALRVATRLPVEAAPDDAERLRILGFKKGNPYFATWGTTLHDEIDWELAARFNSPGRDGVGAGEPERAPGVGEPGNKDDSNSEVGDD